MSDNRLLIATLDTKYGLVDKISHRIRQVCHQKYRDDESYIVIFYDDNSAYYGEEETIAKAILNHTIDIFANLYIAQDLDPYGFPEYVHGQIEDMLDSVKPNDYFKIYVEESGNFIWKEL